MKKILIVEDVELNRDLLVQLLEDEYEVVVAVDGASGLELAASEGVVSNDPALGAGRIGVQYLARQAVALGGGSNEMQRNSISERVLGMPREPKPAS